MRGLLKGGLRRLRKSRDSPVGDTRKGRKGSKKRCESTGSARVSRRSVSHRGGGEGRDGGSELAERFPLSLRSLARCRGSCPRAGHSLADLVGHRGAGPGDPGPCGRVRIAARCPDPSSDGETGRA